MPQINEPPSYSTVLPKWGHKSLIKLFDDFNNLFSEIELDMVVSGKRDVDVYHMYPDNYDKQMEQLNDKGLIFSPIHRVKSFRGFANKLTFVNNLSQDTMVYGVVARDQNTAKKFAAYAQQNDHLNVGLMLGYPECCCQAFVDYSKYNMDPVFEIAQNSPHTVTSNGFIITGEGFHPGLQVHLRYFGLRLIPWFPCSYVCDESIEKSKEWIQVLTHNHNNDVQVSTDVIDIMNMPSVWDLYNAQVVVNRPPHKESLFFGYATSYYHSERRVVKFFP